MIETPHYPVTIVTVENRVTLDQTLRNLEEKCKKCKPLTALTCVTECKTWILKNQIRKLNEKLSRPNYLELLLNTLKNRRRLQILEMASKQHYSISKIQQKLSENGYKHSVQTILEEYIRPLEEVGLLQEGRNPFDLTILGSKVSELIKNFPDLEETLPPHSECYEERAVESMLSGPKTYEEIRRVIPRKSAARVLSRLQKASLVESNSGKNYIFFFQTKRCPSLENLSPTESRVYENIPDQGIFAKKLANDAGISLRRTYKYLRKLKGKKLIFERTRPLTYGLTDSGIKLGSMLKSLRNLVGETRITSEKFLKDRR